MTLKTAMTLGDIDLGETDAEAERRLSEYFVSTPTVESALGLKRSHIVGRKGAGKSALFSQLERLFREADETTSGTSKCCVICLTPDQYAWSQLKQYREQGLLPEQAHTNAWKFTIAIEIASALASLDDALLSSGDVDVDEALRSLRTFVQQNYLSEPSLGTSAARLLKGLKGFNFSAFGFGAGLDLACPQQPSTPHVIQAILDKIERVVADIGVVVALDKLDDSWDASDESRNLLIGLLKATKELNDRMRTDLPSSGLALLVFLRTDIYEGLQFDDKDKHRALEEHIVWTAELLEEMVNQRLPEGVNAVDLFEDGDMRGSIAPFNYLVKRTFLRPREVLQFLKECMRTAGSGAIEITKDHVREAEERYSSWKVEDLKQEYRRVHPQFERLLEALRQGTHRFDSIEEFNAYLEEKAPDPCEQLGTRGAVEVLFNASVIGVRVSNSGSPRFRCEDSDLVLPSSGGVYVHQGLYKGLSIVERRAS
jgi:hypothetical protein